MSYKFILRDEESSVYNALADLLSETGKWSKAPKESSNFHVMFGDRNKLPWSRFESRSGFIQMVNYYRGSSVLCRKVSLVRKLTGHLEAEDHVKTFPWLPCSFVIYPKVNAQDVGIDQSGSLPMREKIQLLKAQSRQQKDNRESYVEHCSKFPSSVWIAKSSNGAQGDGIQISTNPQYLLDFIDEQTQAHVIQQYLTEPMLLEGDRKFDIRCWVLLDQDYNIHLFKEGVLRTASDKYDDDYSNKTAHLTNHHLQEKLSANYENYEKGNEMFFEDFNRFLLDKYEEDMDERIIPQIKNIITITLLHVKNEIHSEDVHYRSFQLFGYDFMLDKHMKVWLLEINANPACAQKLLRSLVESIYITTMSKVYHMDQMTNYRDSFVRLYTPST